MAISKGEHHATRCWDYNAVIRTQYPWDSLAIEWAYTGKRKNHKGDSVAAAPLAETWLLSCYIDAYGELPLLNQKALTLRAAAGSTPSNPRSRNSNASTNTSTARIEFLTANLSSCWVETGTYTGARIAFDTALAQDAIMETSQDLGGIHVMTIHRAKGKQFDGVVIVLKGVPGTPWTSSFIWRDDAAPYHRSRKILRVAITRARKHVLILDPAFPNCPLLQGHVL
jgi:hypothetical protein